MRIFPLLTVIGGTLAIAGVAAPSSTNADAGAAPSIPACVRVATQSRYIPFGYNHVVVLENGCSKAASCMVSTNVSPEPRTVDVPPAKTVEVLTYMAAASSTFVARVDCRLR